MPLSRHEVADRPVSEKLDAIKRMMRAYFVVLRTFGKTGASTPEAFYGFHARDVSEIHFYKAGFGRGVWYRLKDGRVLDSLGRPARRDRVAYAMRPPKAIRSTVTLSPPVAKIGKLTRHREHALKLKESPIDAVNRRRPRKAGLAG